MRKIVLCLLLSVFIAATAFAGGGRQARRVDDGQITVRLLTDATGIDDRSFNAAAWRGILEFYGDTWYNQRGRGTLYQVITAPTMDFYIPNLRTATDEGHDLIIVTGFTWANALNLVASQNPNQKYMIVDVDWVDQPNVMGATYAEHEGSFLVGVAAALKAIESGIANPRFGFIGGIPGAVITRFHVGYVQGVLSVLPNAQFVDYYANDWGRPDLAMTQAMNWFNDDVFVIFSAAGGTGNGTIAQAREERLAGRNVWAIGVDSDQHLEGVYNAAGDSAVLTSMLKVVESSVIYALEAVRDGNFSGRSVNFGLRENGVGFSTTNPALSPSIVRQVNQVRDDIIAGRIIVYPTLREAMANVPNFPRNLMARDD